MLVRLNAQSTSAVKAHQCERLIYLQSGNLET